MHGGAGGHERRRDGDGGGGVRNGGDEILSGMGVEGELSVAIGVTVAGDGREEVGSAAAEAGAEGVADVERAALCGAGGRGVGDREGDEVQEEEEEEERRTVVHASC